LLALLHTHRHTSYVIDEVNNKNNTRQERKYEMHEL
jgi:hypothetical protein